MAHESTKTQIIETLCPPALHSSIFGEQTEGRWRAENRLLASKTKVEGTEGRKSSSPMVDSLLSQLTFIENDVSLMSRSQIGNAGESWAYAEFERAGYDVARTGYRDAQGDLRVVDVDTGEVWRVEVKAMRRDGRGRYQACLRRQIKARVCTDSSHAQVVLLLAFPRVGEPIPFLIPQNALQGMKQIHIGIDPRTYTGKWSIYRQLDGLKMPANLREDE